MESDGQKVEAGRVKRQAKGQGRQRTGSQVRKEVEVRNQESTRNSTITPGITNKDQAQE